MRARRASCSGHEPPATTAAPARSAGLIRRLGASALLLGLAAGLLVFMQATPLHGDGLLLEALLDAGHAPLFGLLALCLLLLSRLWIDWHPSHHIRHYLLAFGLTVTAGLVSEAAQFAGPRDADPMDFLRDVLGAGAFLCLAGVFDRRARRRRAGPVALAGLGSVLFLGACFPLITLYWAIDRREAVFPRMAGFETRWERRFVVVKDARLDYVSRPEGWEGAGGVIRVRFLPRDYSGWGIQPYPDWGGFRWLALEVYSEREETVALEVRIHDSSHDETYYDRFNATLTVQPGVNAFRIPLSDVRTGPRTREMDLSEVSNLFFFLVRPPEAFDLYFDAVRLE